LRDHLKTLQFQVLVSDVTHKDLKLKCFGVTSQLEVTIVCFGRFNWS